MAAPHAKVDEQTLGLITENKRLSRDIAGSLLDALGYFSLGATLWYLWGCIRARNPDVKPGFVGYIAVVGAVLTGISIPAYVILYGQKAHDFVALSAQTYPQANHLISSTSLVFPQLGNYLGVLLSAMAVVLVSLNAMRVGLLTRFMGFLGIFAGVLVIFPLVPIPIVEGFWLVALGLLFSGRWPNGMPPAWRSGRPEPWPSSQAMREQRAARGGGGGSGPRGGGGLLGGLVRPKPASAPPRRPSRSARRRRPARGRPHRSASASADASGRRQTSVRRASRSRPRDPIMGMSSLVTSPAPLRRSSTPHR